MNPLEFIKKHKVISVVRAGDEALALSFAEACIAGGLRLIEVTFSFPGAEDVISRLSERIGILVGAGTVLDIDMAERARDAGARFLVSPHTDEALIHFAKGNGMAVIQGAFTSSEIVSAWKLGVDMVKIFPVSAVGGPSYVRAMKEPLPQIDIMTTGGVGLDNLADFLSAGASAVGISTALTGRGGRIDPETITSNARLFAEKLEEISRA
ncbi:MAG: bifunctional 4-hydroxy-2-oxoglutarate aldolase/2-dehydro-3-deoxy-phosphogluconate aldolase [Candidatus Dadabacteria bacterium]|nr:bifunctional 4-hydroxy-2-oxoglutarate aldolase/2-dehydro-3-deoxy-phosphogluconate aldolase [Candidatus Dadabacteria bacterium]